MEIVSLHQFLIISLIFVHNYNHFFLYTSSSLLFFKSHYHLIRERIACQDAVDIATQLATAWSELSPVTHEITI